MEALITLARWELILFLSVLAALVGHQLLTRRINTSGLLRLKTRSQGQSQGIISPARIQLLFVTGLGTAASLSGFAASGDTTLKLLPEEGLLAIGGSQLLYLYSKYQAFQAGPTEPSELTQGG